VFYSPWMRGIGGCIAVFAGTLALVPAAAGVTFGTDLNRPANNPYTCSDFGYGPITCSAESQNPYTGESFFPPVGTGTITSVRVKVGPVTGPMQVVVEEALRRDNPGDPGHPTYVCCKAIEASGVFTPKANAITEVDVDLSVRQDLSPSANGFYVDQHLALSVLDPGVPIPASQDQNASVGLWFPAWEVGEERAGSYGTAGADVLMSADWQASGAGFGGGGVVSLADKSANVARGKALVELACNLDEKCAGTLTLSDQQATSAPPFGGKRAKTYAEGDFKIKPGKTKTVKAKLTRKGEKLLEDKNKAKVWGNVQLKGTSTVAATFKVKLKG
jgi:hypothetical protein